MQAAAAAAAIIHLRLHQERGPTAEATVEVMAPEAQQLQIQVVEAAEVPAMEITAARAVQA